MMPITGKTAAAQGISPIEDKDPAFAKNKRRTSECDMDHECCSQWHQRDIDDANWNGMEFGMFLIAAVVYFAR